MKIWEGGKDMGVASLVLGILAILITVFTGGSFGWIEQLAILGTILGAVGRKS